MMLLYCSVFQPGFRRHIEIKHRCDISTHLVYYRKSDRHLDHCMRFHEQRKHLQKVPLQQKGWKTLLCRNKNLDQCFLTLLSVKPTLRTVFCSHANLSSVQRVPMNSRFGNPWNIRYKIWNLASALEWDFTVQVVWWYCAFAHLRRKIGPLCEPTWQETSLSECN